MKRTVLVFLLVNLMLSACAPASAPMPTPVPSATPLPTATAMPTSTATPTSTPTAIPTATPTPIPTIQVGDLSVPDPRATNPELFDLRNPGAPIPQFVNAMKMAGIEITAEQVAQGITYEALEDKDGNPFIVAVYNPDPALFPEQYRDLAGPIPLLIATGKDTWLWNRATIRLLAEFNSLSIGVLFGGWFLRDPSYMGNKYMSIPANHFNLVHDHSLFMQTNIESGMHNLVKSPSQYDFTIPDYTYRWAVQHRLPIVFSPLFGGNSNEHIPNWLKSINEKGKFVQSITNHISEVLSHYADHPIPVSYIVINEYFGDPFTNDPSTYFWRLKANQLGVSDLEFMRIIFQTAKQADPSARLVFNEYGYEIPNSYNYTSDKDRKIEELMRNCVDGQIPIDAVGFQMHLYGRDFASRQKFQQLVENLRQQIRKYKELGLEVDITELDVRLDDLPHFSLEERLQLQALVYKGIIKAAIEEGVGHITIWGISDRDSWLNRPEITGSDSFESRPLLFDNEDNPKIAYFALLSGLLELGR